MLYINTDDLKRIGTDWESLIQQIRKTAEVLYNKDFHQPIKPYLRYGNPRNRIIAMPAYVGGDIKWAGIKWIASFPDNIKSNVQRAHSITVVNDPDSGKPLCVVNSATISAIRTAGVSGLVMQDFLKTRADLKELSVGITGLGPIGKTHLKMIDAMYGERVKQYRVYDLLPIDLSDLPDAINDKLERCTAWEEAYTDADIFATCTVTKERYIDKPPKKGSLQLNVSLRDYYPQYKNYVDVIVVDDWEEICRENTDIEKMHIEYGLTKDDTFSISQMVCENVFKSLTAESVVMFNPMGMAVFDLALGGYYYEAAMKKQMGTQLND